MTKRKVYFRADASAEIGYGHFIRSLALADMLKDDFECIFFTVSPSSYQVEEMKKVCSFISLNPETKFEDFFNYLQGNEIVVLDNYFFTVEYQKQIKQIGCKLVCIDDMHDRHYVADVVVNQSLTDSSLFDVEAYTKLCLGIDWMLLREPFLSVQKRHNHVSKPINRVAISFGGADPLNLTYQALLQLVTYDQIATIDVIGGVKSELINDSRINFYQYISAKEICNIFTNCDLAIVSLSTVCLEALMCGAHVISGWYVDNQEEGYYSLLKQGVIHGMGNIEHGLPDLKPYLSLSKLPQFERPKDIRCRYIELFKTL